MIKKAFPILAALVLTFTTPVVVAGCAAEDSAAVETTAAQTASTSESSAPAETTATAVSAEAAYATYDSEDEDASWDASAASHVTLAGSSVRFDGAGATVNGSTITIGSAGTYVISGTLDDGQVIVDTDTEGTVRLVLNGADLACSSSAPIYVKSADKTIITLADGAENSITDGTDYTYDYTEDQAAHEPNAAIFSKDDLTINGPGALTVTAHFNNGIASKDDLKITGGTITVEAANDGLKGRDCIGIKAGTVTIDAGGDGLQATNDEDAGKGYISIEGGTFTIASGDDGIHADASLEVNGGEITISRSYEGLESATMTINDGTIHVQSSDDGINVGGGADGSSVTGRAGQNAFTVNENNQLYLHGGYVAIDADGDALDCNGRIFMTEGVVILNGPTNDGNGAIDYLGEFTVSGGLLVAAGSSGMAEAPSESSTQNSLMVNLDQVQQAGTLVHIVSLDGDEVITMAPTKQYQSVVVSSPAIEQGATYRVYLGGSSTGTPTDSLYTDGTYTPGTETAALTVEGVLTTYGSAGMRGMQGGGTQGGGRQADGVPPSRP